MSRLLAVTTIQGRRLFHSRPSDCAAIVFEGVVYSERDTKSQDCHLSPWTIVNIHLICFWPSSLLTHEFQVHWPRKIKMLRFLKSGFGPSLQNFVRVQLPTIRWSVGAGWVLSFPSLCCFQISLDSCVNAPNVLWKMLSVNHTFLLFDLWVRLDRGWFVECFLEMFVVLMRVVHYSWWRRLGKRKGRGGRGGGGKDVCILASLRVFLYAK